MKKLDKWKSDRRAEQAKYSANADYEVYCVSCI